VNKVNKNPMLAFLLSCLPGVGHFYLGRKIRGFFYGTGVIVTILFFLFLAAANPYDEVTFIIIGLFIAVFIWGINMLDMILFLLKNNQQMSRVNVQTDQNDLDSPVSVDNERFYTILMSFIPGLGHFHLGLMNRGLTFLIGFFGLGIMIVFITLVTHQGGFMVFLGVLPIIWIYNMFDSIQQLNRKQKGEELVDRTILEDFEETRHEQGKKSKALATILSMFPGAGHMYLGLQRRGLQLMAAFLFGIYILDILRLTVFLFLIPLIWFYSFFDALQKVSKHGEEEIEDIPLVSYFINHQRWIGIGLIILGMYYMFDNIVIPIIEPSFSQMFGINFHDWYYNYFQMAVICILLIGGGIKLLFGSKNRKESV
jgi:hypothetical protein